MVLVKPKEDPLDVRIERVLVSQQEAVVVLSTANGDYQGRVLPVFVDLGQAMNIQVGLEAKRAGRPLTHDLFTNVLNEMGCQVVKVVIEEIAANTFFATLHIDLDREGKRETVTFDARPSDCLALAVRSGSQIKVRRKVLDAAGVDREKLFGASPEIEEDDEDAEPSKAERKPGDRLDPSEFEKP
jgi:uncharacterized protein